MSSADEHTTSSSEEESDNGSHSSEESNDEAGDEPEYFENSEDDTKKRHQRGSPHREKKSECRDQSGTAKRTSEDAEKIDRTRRNPSPGPSRSVTPTRDEKKAPPIRNPKKKLHKAPPQQSRTDSRRKPSYDVYSPETRSPTPLVDEIDELSPPEEIYQPPIQHKKKNLQKSQQSRTQDSDGRRNPPETKRRARSVTPTDDEEKAPLPPSEPKKKKKKLNKSKANHTSVSGRKSPSYDPTSPGLFPPESPTRYRPTTPLVDELSDPPREIPPLPKKKQLKSETSSQKSRTPSHTSRFRPVLEEIKEPVDPPEVQKPAFKPRPQPRILPADRKRASSLDSKRFRDRTPSLDRNKSSSDSPEKKTTSRRPYNTSTSSYAPLTDEEQKRLAEVLSNDSIVLLDKRKQTDKKVIEHLFEQKQRNKELALDVLESYSKRLPQHRRSPVYRSIRDQTEKVKRVNTDFLFPDIFTYYPVTQWTCMRCGFYTGHRCKAIRFPGCGMTPTSDSNHRLTTFKDDINSPLICDFCGSLAFHTKCLDYKSDRETVNTFEQVGCEIDYMSDRETVNTFEQVGCEIGYICAYPNCPGAFWHRTTSGTKCILIADKKDDRLHSCSCGQIDFFHLHQSIQFITKNQPFAESASEL